VPVLRRRVQTLERRVAQSTGPAAPSRGTPTSVPALRATPASVPARRTPASTPAISARATPTPTPAVRTIPPGHGPSPGRAPPMRPDARPIKKANTVDLLEDPETRELMLGQFWQFEGVNGVAIISSTGKVASFSRASRGWPLHDVGSGNDSDAGPACEALCGAFEL